MKHYADFTSISTAVSSDIMMICGDESVTWDDFTQAVQYAVDLGVLIAYGGSTTFQARKLFETRLDFQRGQLLPLHETLLRNRSFLATDDRDKVFGLLSLASPESVQSMGVRPNYRLTTNQLYLGIAQSLLKRFDLSVFSASGVHDGVLEKNLPSWVPDWSTSDPSAPLSPSPAFDPGHHAMDIELVNMQVYAARTSFSTARIDHHTGQLGLEGILIDQVEIVGSLCRTRYLRHVSHMFELFVQCHDILEQLKNWEQVAAIRSRKLYLTGEKGLDAYWKTLCAGRMPKGVVTARQDPRFKYYRIIRSLRFFVRLTVRWFPRSEKNTWYNRLFYSMFETGWRIFGLTPAKIQRLGFPPESWLSNHRRMIRTKKGYFALAPRFTKPGDWIGVFKGGKLPLIIRKDGEQYVLVGESYVHGIMKGEAWDESTCETMWFR